MHFGKLRQRLTVQYSTLVGSTNTGSYEGERVWLDWKENVPCMVSVRRGQEHFARIGENGEGQRFSKDQWQFTVRQQSLKGIDSTMRVLHKGNIYDIRHIRPDGQYGWDMVLECEVQDIVVGNAPLRASINNVIPQGTAGQPYLGFTVTVTGGTAPYSFTDDTGGLPPGIAIDSASGVVSGTPIQVGEWPCSVIVYDAAGVEISLDFVIVVVAASVQSYSYTVTAGQDASWAGFIDGGFGSISADPIVGGSIQSTVSAKSVPGEGGIEIVGDAEVLHSALIGKEVYIAGSKIANPDGWQFQSGVAIWWVSSGFPSFVSGNDYLIEIK